MSEYLGTKLAVEEVPRLTTQVAITLAQAMGNRECGRAERFRAWASRTLFGALRAAFLDVNLCYLDEDTGEVHKEWERYRAWRSDPRNHARNPLQGISDAKLDAVFVPLDGANALRKGRDGSLSVIAVGFPHCFVQKTFKDNAEEKPQDLGARPSPTYFVVVVGHDAVTGAVEQALASIDNSKPVSGASAVGIDEFLRTNRLLDKLVQALAKDRHEPTLAILLNGDPYRRWVPPIGPHYMGRHLHGSSVAAALAALRGRVPISVFAARLPAAIQIAVATRGLSGRMYAFPIVEDRRQRPMHIRHVTVPPRAIVRTEKDFVEDKNVVLVSTSITEICAQDRVRYLSSFHVSINTLIVSLATKALRDITHSLDLSRTTFRDHDGNEVPAIDELNKFKKELQDSARCSAFGQDT